MIGALLFTNDENEATNKLLYHKFSGKAIAEHTLSAYLRAEQIQKVIMIMPQSERKHISGTSVQTPLISKDRLDFPRRIDAEFYVENTDIITFAHQVATDHALDHIVIGDLSTGLIPRWLINEVVYSYFKNNEMLTTYNFTEQSFNVAFKMSVMPYWHLARMASHSEDRLLKVLYDLKLFPNVGEHSITSCKHSLILSDLAQADVLDFVYSEAIAGVDINDIIEEVNGK